VKLICIAFISTLCMDSDLQKDQKNLLNFTVFEYAIWSAD